MSDDRLLSDDEIADGLADHPGWRREGDEIVRDFSFADFAQAFAFMTQCADLSEELNHHPDWRNVYSSVWVRLTTHDVGGLSPDDLRWAARASALADRG